jgi:CheY-like chemotaxis protein
MRDVRASWSGLRKKRAHAPGDALRVLVADDDATRRRVIAALIVEKYAPAVALEATDVPNAIEALLVRHPDLVVADLCLSGHTQGGFRLILDATSLGVPAVVTSGPISRALETRLAELGVGWVPKGSSEGALFAAIDRALTQPERPREAGDVRPPPSGPRMHTA